MCGIAMLHSTGNAAETREATVAEGGRMLQRLAHRGPDGAGSKQVGPTWLGHTRLSIVDIKGGAQPMVDEGSAVWMVCNGEIYNHDELRGLLPGRFRSDSDSEVALHVVDEWGPEGVERLRGMFALCLAHADGRMLIARDPVGIKPLYWARRGEQIVVASELRGFDPQWRPLVEEFPPGYWWTPARGLVQFATLRSEAPFYASEDEARTALRQGLVMSVRRHTMADVPVGVFLSGGLDSSVIAAVLAREAAGTGEPVYSFAAGTEGSPDLAAARVVADYLGLAHYERVYTADDVVRVLPEVVASTESYEPSLIRSAVPNYLLSELAAEHVKVVLTGEGADELLAGYEYLREITDSEALHEELLRSIEGLHNLNLQRCDRVTMAHGLEARVPFLELDFIALAQRIPVAWKLPGELGQEKRLLREAFEGWLPQEILWRVKAQFGDGSGTADVMTARAEQIAPDEDWESVHVTGLPRPRSREELGYQRMFAEVLEGVRADQVLGRFATA